MSNIFKILRCVSLWVFVTTAMLYLLQAYPPHPYFMILMFLNIYMWSVYMINGFFLAIMFDVVVGSLPRWFIIIPVAYISGYWTYTALEYKQYHELREEIFSENEKVKIPFDPNKQVLSTNGIDEAMLLAQHGLDYIVVGNNLVQLGYAKECDKMRKKHQLGIFTNYIYVPNEYMYEKRYEGGKLKPQNNVDNVCLIRYPGKSDKPSLSVVSYSDDKYTQSNSLPVKKEKITITTEDGEEYVLRGGYAAPLTWFPMPIIGCFLNSSPAAWNCFHGFQRDINLPLNKSPDGRHYLARALGLEFVDEDKFLKMNREPIDFSAVVDRLNEERK
ncbi:MAG: hypothetical protein GC137_09815 [Alphaproteobacteria bacterium]|nr:hypothetical protein [Alphaproteobacteria bacterium]